MMVMHMIGVFGASIRTLCLLAEIRLHSGVVYNTPWSCEVGCSSLDFLVNMSVFARRHLKQLMSTPAVDEWR